MYISISEEYGSHYGRLQSLTFDPETDLTLSTIPVNGFTADIITDEEIHVGQHAELYDDLDNLWAICEVVKARRLDRQTLRIEAQSMLGLMDRWTLSAERFSSVDFKTFLERIFTDMPETGAWTDIDYQLDSFYSAKAYTVDGFCPSQTARTRLQWLCMMIGATVRQSFTGVLTIEPLPDVDPAKRDAPGVLIPVWDTFWKPTNLMKDQVRSVSVTLYSHFSTEQDELDDMSAEDSEGTTWYFRSSWADFNDGSGSGNTAEAQVSGVTILSADLYEAHPEIISSIAAAQFRRREITLDVVNNAQYYPGQKVMVYTDEDTIWEGCIQSCAFSFGTQARSRLTLMAEEEPVETGKLTFKYMHGEEYLGRRTITYPIGYEYSFTAPVLTLRRDGGEHMMMPLRNPVTGTVWGDDEIIIQYYEMVGNIRLYIRPYEGSGNTYSFKIYQTEANSVKIYWGDGTLPETIAQTGLRTVSHTYAQPESRVVIVQMPESRAYIRHTDNYWLTRLVTQGALPYFDECSFEGCTSLTDVKINGAVPGIGKNAFYGCERLSGIVLPDSVAFIDDYAFSNCEKLSLAKLPAGCTRIGYAAFDGCDAITAIDIHDHVETMGEAAFRGCDGLKRVRIGSRITRIEQEAFAACRALPEIVIPAGITEIGAEAFINCEALTRAVIPSTVTGIEREAFAYCGQLREIRVRAQTPPDIDYTPYDGMVFDGIAEDYVIYVPAGTLSDYRSAPGWREYASHMQEEET